jgi:hypothetical protein
VVNSVLSRPVLLTTRSYEPISSLVSRMIV